MVEDIKERFVAWGGVAGAVVAFAGLISLIYGGYVRFVLPAAKPQVLRLLKSDGAATAVPIVLAALILLGASAIGWSIRRSRTAGYLERLLEAEAKIDLLLSAAKAQRKGVSKKNLALGSILERCDALLSGPGDQRRLAYLKYDEAKKVFSVAAEKKLSVKLIKAVPTMFAGGIGVASSVVRLRQPQLLSDVRGKQARTAGHIPADPTEEYRALACVPIINGADDVVGVLCVEFKRQHRFGKPEETMLNRMAERIALAEAIF